MKCKVPSCNVTKKYLSLGYCTMHYGRYYKYGTVEPSGSFVPHINHGLSGTPEYGVWEGIVQRCTNPKNRHFNNYGGRGIEICNKWRKSFKAFYEDVGTRPTEKHTIERIDNNGNYEPGNVKWSTRAEQNDNRRNTLKYNGILLKDWAYKLGINPRSLSRNVHLYGWEEAIFYYEHGYKKYCRNGHENTDESRYIFSTGKVCKKCAADAQRAKRRSKKIASGIDIKTLNGYLASKVEK